MERLCDVQAKRLVVLCSPCGRRGSYGVERLRQRFGAQASMLDVYLTLTQTCRFQREAGSRTPNVYGLTCRAKLDTTGGPTSAGLPSRT
ncbi:hypothetical protein ASF49_14230 [Methylobacterium sp. Leaf104]|uniref:hypothetical protein n=1 Tax=Methylobacterium TaxID=407 RepID=UPI0007022740|nr:MULTISPECIES: hypothetical protein [Methylobacterium]KQP29840.1 hypothetical protein ASF49_14230 [Methylobacterium sp. Leaf104]MCI9882477.1 hypothetical protein [Methylobacterium goesingense]